MEGGQCKALAGSAAGTVSAGYPVRDQAALCYLPPRHRALAAPVEPCASTTAGRTPTTGILGADNKTAVAIVLEPRAASPLLRGRRRSGSRSLFTVCEEVSLRGSREFDAGRLRSRRSHVFDHATRRVARIVLASPTTTGVWRVPWPRRAPVCDRRMGAARSPPRRRGSPRYTALAAGRGDDGQCRHDLRRLGDRRRARRCTLEAEVRGLDGRARRSGEHGAHRPPAGCPLTTRPNARSILTVRRMFKELPHASPATAACSSPGSPGGLRVRAKKHRHRWRLRTRTRSRTTAFPAINLADGTERNHASPPQSASASATPSRGMFEVAGALLSSKPGRGRFEPL